MSYKDLLGATATITTIGQFLSGMFTIKKILSQGQVGQLSAVPFVAGVVGSALWYLYGHFKGDPTITTCNIVGTALNAFYVFVFIRYTSSRTLLYRQVLASLIFLTIVGGYVLTGGDGVVDTLGLICVVVTLACCASPCVALKEVFRQKSTSTLPFPLILSTFLVCSQWWAYGYLQEDFYMQFTNLLGSLIALAQLGLFCIFPNTDYNSDNDLEKLVKL